MKAPLIVRHELGGPLSDERSLVLDGVRRVLMDCASAETAAEVAQDLCPSRAHSLLGDLLG